MGRRTGRRPTLGLVDHERDRGQHDCAPARALDDQCDLPGGTPRVQTSNKSGAVNIWVKPDGVYGVERYGDVATTTYPGPITVVVS